MEYLDADHFKTFEIEIVFTNQYRRHISFRHMFGPTGTGTSRLQFPRTLGWFARFKRRITYHLNMDERFSQLVIRVVKDGIKCAI